MSVLAIRAVAEESGQDLIEYGLLVGIITVTVVTLIPTIGAKATGYFTALCAVITC